MNRIRPKIEWFVDSETSHPPKSQQFVDISFYQQNLYNSANWYGKILIKNSCICIVTRITIIT